MRLILDHTPKKSKKRGKIVKAYVLILALGAAGAYAYTHPDTLRTLPSLSNAVSGGDNSASVGSPPEARVAADHSAILKCISRTGQVVFSNHPCENGDAEQAVKLSASTRAHLPPQASRTGATP